MGPLFLVKKWTYFCAKIEGFNDRDLVIGFLFIATSRRDVWFYMIFFCKQYCRR